MIKEFAGKMDFRKYESQIILFAGSEHILQENGIDLKLLVFYFLLSEQYVVTIDFRNHALRCHSFFSIHSIFSIIQT